MQSLTKQVGMSIKAEIVNDKKRKNIDHTNSRHTMDI